jgi:hypothetical protein
MQNILFTTKDKIYKTYGVRVVSNPLHHHFLTYRQRHMVYSKKKELKGHVDKTFITENLTRHR